MEELIFQKIFTDIYPNEIVTNYGLSESLTCLVIVENKTLSQGL
jgi:hypothetical protein